MAPRTIASQIYPHLPSVEQTRPQREQPRLADVMWPALSRGAKAQQAKNEQWQAEQQARNKRLADNLQATIDAIRAEKRGR